MCLSLYIYLLSYLLSVVPFFFLFFSLGLSLFLSYSLILFLPFSLSPFPPILFFSLFLSLCILCFLIKRLCYCIKTIEKHSFQQKNRFDINWILTVVVICFSSFSFNLILTQPIKDKCWPIISFSNTGNVDKRSILYSP